jgi:putative Holliday junction resolvase
VSEGSDGPRGRALGLDLGDVQIGVAISDPERRLAVPLGDVRTGAPGDLKAVAKIVAENDVALVVVGDPLLLSGEHGDRSRKAAEFAKALEAVLSVPVELQDERLSTAEAERALREAGNRARDRRRVVDRTAATVILQAYLDANTR